MIIETIIDSRRVYHVSNLGVMLQQVETGKLFNDAIDKIPCQYTYEETDIPIKQDEEHGDS